MIVITGAGGVVGTMIAHRLNTQGTRFIACDIQKSRYVNCVADYSTLDLSVFAPKSVILLHLAAANDVRRSFFAPDEYHLNNFEKPKLFIDKNKKYINTVLYPSSCSVYSSNINTLISELTQISPTSPYSQSKYNFELFITDASRYGINSIILRTFNVVSYSGMYRENPLNSGRIFPSIFRSFLSDDSFEIFGMDHDTIDGTCVRDYIHVSDYCDLLVKILSKDISRSTSIFNVGSGTGYSVYDVIHRFEAMNAVRIKVKRGPKRPGDVSCRIADSRLVQAHYDWKPARDPLSLLSLSLRNRPE